MQVHSGALVRLTVTNAEEIEKVLKFSEHLFKDGIMAHHPQRRVLQKKGEGDGF
jgi:hypothetical protein